MIFRMVNTFLTDFLKPGEMNNDQSVVETLPLHLLCVFRSNYSNKNHELWTVYPNFYPFIGKYTKNWIYILDEYSAYTHAHTINTK